jgi:hypothetical protein
MDSNGDALSGGPKQRIGGGDLISGNQATTREDQMVPSQSEYRGTEGTVTSRNADTI